jgi:hypothetical protein
MNSKLIYITTGEDKAKVLEALELAKQQEKKKSNYTQK